MFKRSLVCCIALAAAPLARAEEPVAPQPDPGHQRLGYFVGAARAPDSGGAALLLPGARHVERHVLDHVFLSADRLVPAELDQDVARTARRTWRRARLASSRNDEYTPA